MNRLLPLATLLAATLFAQAPRANTPPDWAGLSEADRAALLVPVQERWNRATPEQRERMLQRARLWASMTPEQKAPAREGMRRDHQHHRERRAKMREIWRNLESLPAEQREQLRAQWRALSPEQRRAWLEAGGPGKAPPPAQ